MADLKTLSTIDTSPFKRLVLQLGGTPSVFSEGMTYYELLAYLVNFLEKEVVPKTNENIEAVKELQEYVSTYFDNLDVQEEINNKLDQMAEDGTLAEIVTAYLNAKSILAYNTISEMSLATNIIDGSFLAVYGLNELNDHVLTFYKAREIKNTDVVDGINLVALNDENLVAEIMTDPQITGFPTTNELINANLLTGQIVKTLGYHSLNDGGAASYIISETPGTVNIELNNGLYANLIFEDINLMQFGCYGNGVTDDTSALQNAITIAKANNKKITSPSGKSYLTTETLDFSNLFVDLNYSEIKTSMPISIITLNTQTRFGELTKITLNCTNALIGIEIVNARTCSINHINIVNVSGIGIKKTAGYEVNIKDCHILGTSTSLNSIGIDVNSADDYYDTIIMTNINTAFHLNALGINIVNCHAWVGSTSVLTESAFLKVENIENPRIFITNTYCDTYKYFVYYKNANGVNRAPFINMVGCDMETNLEFYTDAIGDQYWFYFEGGNEYNTDQIDITNCTYIGITGQNSLTVKSYMCNNMYLHHQPLINGVRVENIGRTRTFTVDNSKFKGSLTVRKDRSGNISIYGEVRSYINYTDTAFTLPDYMLPTTSRFIGTCQVANDEWATTSTNGYIYIGDNGNMQIGGASGTSSAPKYVRIDISYPTRR